MQIINRGLANRKTRNNATNDVSSRSILVLNVYVEDTKVTIVDLAGQERPARLDINEKRYREALFINESLDCLMDTTQKISRGVVPRYNIHPTMEMLADTL